MTEQATGSEKYTIYDTETLLNAYERRAGAHKKCDPGT